MQTKILTLIIALCFVAPFACSNYAEADSSDTTKIQHVLFLVSDDLKASALGCYGNSLCKTPNIDRLAKEGMVFEHAYCQGLWCAPSRTSFMFSRYQGEGEINLGQCFREAGWHSARVGKIYHMRVPGDIIAGTDGNDIPSSWDERFNSAGLEAHTPGHYACLNLNIFTDALENRQSTRMPHRMFVTVRYDGDGTDQPDSKSATKAIELLQEHRNKNMFLAVGFVRPHYPNVAPQDFFDHYPWETMPLPQTVEDDLSDIPKAGLAKTRNDNNPIGEYPDNQRRMWAGYYATVEFMDRQVGRILDELDQAGLRDSTAIVFCSDHGYHLGEHGFWQKHNYHEDVTRVPLIISAPGIPPGRTRSLVELVDIFPTLTDLTHIQTPPGVQGKSLVPLLKNPTDSVRDSALSLHKGHSLRTDEWAFMRYSDDSEELYDMNNDPLQFTNLAGKSEFQEIKNSLATQLQQRLRDAQIDK
ncbi:MAG: sulfatase [Pirellulales bacterium]|nr:sulfatase [Pirellulales bacterium]